MALVTPNTALLITSGALTTIATAPTTVADGFSLATWAQGQQFPAQADIYINGSTALTITGPVIVWGWRPSPFAAWYNMGQLNSGSTITIVSATQGYVQRTNIGVMTRIALSGGAISTGNITLRFEPLATTP